MDVSNHASLSASAREIALDLGLQRMMVAELRGQLAQASQKMAQLSAELGRRDETIADLNRRLAAVEQAPATAPAGGAAAGAAFDRQEPRVPAELQPKAA